MLRQVRSHLCTKYSFIAPIISYGWKTDLESLSSGSHYQLSRYKFCVKGHAEKSEAVSAVLSTKQNLNRTTIAMSLNTI